MSAGNPPAQVPLGWNDPADSFGRGIVLKTGVVPAQHSGLPAPKSRLQQCASSSDRDTSQSGEVNRKVNGTVNRVFHAEFTFPRWMGEIETLCHAVWV